MKNTIAAAILAIATLTATSAKAQSKHLVTTTIVSSLSPVGYSTDKLELKDVTPCVFGSMDVTDSGWLVAQDGRKVDFHDLMSMHWVNGISDDLYHTGRTITACQIDGNLRYSVR